MLSDFVSLFFPNCCQVCDQPLVKGESLICIKCEHDLPKTRSHHNTDNFVARKFYGKVRIQYALAYYSFVKGGKVSQLLRALKYRNVPELGVLVGEKYGIELKNTGFDSRFDVVIPVPLHKFKLKRRGYNQSEKFASGLAKSLNLEVDLTSMIRTKDTTTQTNKSRLERWRNVDEKFQLTSSSSLKDKNILLVDDVVTTGATLEACIAELECVQCKSISIATIAAAR